MSLGFDNGPPCPICSTSEYRRLALVPSREKTEPWKIVQCIHCDLVRTLPIPAQADLERLYGVSYFNGWIRDPSATAREKERFRRLFELIRRDVPKGRLLSIGCGLGFDVEVANDLGFDASGLEPSPSAVEYGRAILGVPIVEGTLETFVGDDRPFDVVTFWDVLEHVPQPDAVLRRAASLLRSGGVIVVRAPNVRGLFPQISLALMPFVGEWRHPEPPAHLYDFSPVSLELLANSCGLQVHRILDDEWPLDKLIAISRRPNVTRLLATTLYPAARWLRRGNSMIAILEKPAPHRAPIPVARTPPTELGIPVLQ